MLNDDRRNRAIEQCINDLPLAGKTVVEIGTGTGLIALMFARAGAKRIVTCEMNHNLADVARHIIESTEYNDRITIIERNSSDAIAEGLLPTAPDYIFTETVDCGVVGESFFEIAADIQKIAGPRTIVLPGQVRQIGMVVESQQLLDLNSVDDVCGFDLSVLNAFSTPTYFPVHEQLYDYKALTEPALLRQYKYLSNPPAPTVTPAIVNDGLASGIMSWMEIDFGGHLFSNEPGITSHWHKAFHPFDKPIEMSAGQSLQITMDDDGKPICDLVDGAAHYKRVRI
ncbi:MAG: protein methyltransferase [Rhizobiales bacterium]|nr:protein methyltransferase [Hyphomicrobiales bacterium]